MKNPAAVALGRLGGLKGGKARAASMTAKERSQSALKAARARWGDSKPPAKPNGIFYPTRRLHPKGDT